MAKYNNLVIAEEIRKTAYGKGYYGNSLRVSLDFPFIDSADKSVLYAYLSGIKIQDGNLALLKIAAKIEKLGWWNLTKILLTEKI